MSTRKESASNVPLLMVGLGLVIMIASVIWFVRTSATPAVVETQAVTEEATQADTSDIPNSEIKRVSVGDAKAALDLNQAVFIDTRGELYFSQGHIPGAISMTNDEVAARIGELDPNAWIITYCT
jgi:3-mercaptopyruvate sulfurtransferase SseA